MDQKQKMLGIKIGAGVVVLLLFLWQATSMMTAESEEEANKPRPNPEIPKAAELMPKEPVQKQAPVALAEKEKELATLQQGTQAGYVEALNQLQMLRLNRDIAVVNKEILKAKEDSVTSLAKMNELLEEQSKIKKPTSSGGYSGSAQGPSMQPVTVAAPAPTPVATAPVKTVVQEAPPPPPPTPPADYYTVVSISNIHGHWLAVINGERSLYKVSMGDVLVDDESKVIAIDRAGVTLEKNGIKKKIYMSTII